MTRPRHHRLCSFFVFSFFIPDFGFFLRIYHAWTSFNVLSITALSSRLLIVAQSPVPNRYTFVGSVFSRAAHNMSLCRYCPFTHTLDAVLLYSFYYLRAFTYPDRRTVLHISFDPSCCFLLLATFLVSRAPSSPVSPSEANPRCQVMYVFNCSTTDY